MRRSQAAGVSGLVGALALALAWPAHAEAPARATAAELRGYANELLAHGIRSMGPLQQCAAGDPVGARQMGQRVRSLTVTVGTDGRIGDVRTVPARLVSPTVRTCILGVARAWQLTPPRGGRRSVRLVFTRAQIERVVAQP